MKHNNPKKKQMKDVSVDEYLQKFAWDEAKFSSSKPLGEIFKAIMDVIRFVWPKF